METLTVTITNVAPENGTLLTPVWVGFHNGEFDLYNLDESIFPDFAFIEQIAEDGNAGPLNAAFSNDENAGIDFTIPGLEGDAPGPLDVGETVSFNFTVDPNDPTSNYFSYASMVLPSNDFFVGNGNPLRFEVFDDDGNFLGDPEEGATITVTGNLVRDAGTEVNDEIPANTAFFGQAAPNTGVDENGVVTTATTGFLPPGSGGILDDPNFANADFTQPDYTLATINIAFADAVAVSEPVAIESTLSGDQEVTPSGSSATGTSILTLNAAGDALEYSLTVDGLDFGAFIGDGTAFTETTEDDVTRVHIHNAPSGENGPIVLGLIDLVASQYDDQDADDFEIVLNDDGTVTLTGVWEETDPNTISLSNFVETFREAEEGEEVPFYWNIHTEAFPAGEIRGQLVIDEAPGPIVNLAVAPEAVVEDGLESLVYTFSVDGILDEDLTVNFGVDGTATLDEDYTVTSDSTFTFDASSGSIEIEATEFDLDSGVTSVGLDTALLATLGITVTGTEGTVDANTDGFPDGETAVGFTIAEATDFTYNLENGLTPLEGTIEHTGSIDLTNALGTANVGNFSIGFDATRDTDLASGFFVEDTLDTDLILFDIGDPGDVDTTIDSLSISEADLLVSAEFSEFLGDADLAGTDIGSARIDGISSLVPGTNTGTISITPVADDIAEPDETIALTLTPDPDYTVGTDSAVVGTITTDEDFVPASLELTDDDTFILGGNDPEVTLQFLLESVDADFVNEIGTYIVEPGQSVTDILESGEVIFSSLSSTSQEFLADRGFTTSGRIIDGLSAGQEIGFYVVADTTTDAVLADSSLLDSVLIANSVDFSAVGDGSFTLGFEDGAGEDFNDLVVNVAVVEESLPIGTGLQGEIELIDLSEQSGELISATINATEEAGFGNVGGLYTILDEAGTVFDPVTGQLFTPGDEGYAQAAVNNSVVEFSLINPEPTTLFGGFLYAPYLLSDGDIDQFYSPFLEANADGLDHLVLLGDNFFAFEDELGLGDGDFNDFVFQVDLEVV